MELTNNQGTTPPAPCPKCSVNTEVEVIRICEHVPAAHAQDSFDGVMQALEERWPQVYEGCLFSEPVTTHFGQLYLVSLGCDALAPELAFAGQRNGLCGGAVKGGLFVAVGMHAGEVMLSVEICASPPQHLYGDEIVEVSCTFFGPHAHVQGWGGEVLGKFPLPAGQYRARYTAGDFGDAPGRFKDRPITESYCVVLWPEPPRPDAVIRRTTQAAAYWHKLMQARHFPFEPPKPPTVAKPAVVFDSEMFTCYGIFTVVSTNCHELQPHEAMVGQANGLCGGAVAGGLFLTVGLHTGNVRIAVELHDTAPPLDQWWDEIVEAPCNFTALPVYLNSWDGGGIPLPLDDGGQYRARFCAKSFGKTDSLRPHGGETDECYRLFLWPEAWRPDAVVKQTSDRTAHRHLVMGGSA